MPAPATVISIQSRKGGVGKTSIALSTAVQLAAKGKRVALLDVDHLGTHLSQCLPLDRDYTLNQDGELSLETREFRDQRGRAHPDYLHRPWLTWVAEGNPYHHAAPALESLSDRLVLPASWVERAWQEQSVNEERLYAVRDNLDFYLGSCYVRDIDLFNGSIASPEGADRFTRVLDSLVSGGLGYDYLVVDNQPGLSFSSGVVLAWVLRRAQKKGLTHAWFITQPPWWEQGLIVYETNVYQRFLKDAHAVIVVNRLRWDSWIESHLRPGEVFTTGSFKAKELKRIIGERLFSTPIWKAADFDEGALFERFFTPAGFQLAILGEDSAIAEASIDRDPAGPPTPADRTTKVVDAMERYVASFLAAPLGTRPSPFHRHLSALVNSVLPDK